MRYLQRLPSQDMLITGKNSVVNRAGLIEATYLRPYQVHGAIGPSCAVGLYKDGKVTVWTHSQGVYPLRNALTGMLRMPKGRVHCIHMEGSGQGATLISGRCFASRRC
jgi:CO/xanthine dehydrogenase Mo-binding subunit